MVSELFWIHNSLAILFINEEKFEDAQTHVDHAKVHAVNEPYCLAYAMHQQARVWYGQHRFEEARSEMLRVLDIFEKLGAAHDAESARQRLRQIDAGRAGHPG